MSRSQSKTTTSASRWRPRHRPLLVFSDQGPSQIVAPALFGLGGRDRSWNLHARSFVEANQPQFDVMNIQAQLCPGADEIKLWLRPGGIIGAVPLRAPDTWKVAGGVVVRPRFGWNDIGPLLHRIGWTASPQILTMPFVPGSAREVPPWVLAGPILQRMSRLLKQMHRGFRMHEETRQIPRGQILWQRYITRHMARGEFHCLPCRFPELGPDHLLRAYLRWGLERVRGSLVTYARLDPIARVLTEQADALLFGVRDTPSRVPDKRTLDLLLQSQGLPSEVLHQGLEALGWIVDERGLAGLAEIDGLAWKLPMHELFERWVEHLVTLWTHNCGGQISSGRTGQTSVPIRWDRRAISSLSSLVPDLVVRRGGEAFVFDAKYKGHFEELDDERWMELSEELRTEHRHDLHQILAYAALFEGTPITAVLVYPIRLATWKRLAEQRGAVSSAMLTSGGRPVRLALVGIPLQLDFHQSPASIVRTWSQLFDSTTTGEP